MPMTEEQKRKLLTDRGFDPEKYEVIEGEPEVETSSTPKPKAEAKSSVLGTLGREATRSLIPGGAAGAAMAAVAPWAIPANPILGTIATGAAGIGASVLADMGQDWALSKMLSPETFKATQDQRVTDRQQHPIAGIIGGLAGNLPAGVGPGLSGVKALGKLPLLANRSIGLSADELASLGNAGIGATVSAAGEGYNQYQEGKFSPGQLAAAAGGGLLFSEPIGGRPKVSNPAPKMNPHAKVNQAEVDLMAKRGIGQYDENPDLPEAGRAYTKDRRIETNPLKMGDDTIPHEVTHQYIRDMENSNRSGKIDMADRAIDANVTEEQLVQAAGPEFVKLAQARGLERAKNYLRDVWLGMKERFGSVSAEEYQKLIARAVKDDAPYTGQIPNVVKPKALGWDVMDTETYPGNKELNVPLPQQDDWHPALSRNQRPNTRGVKPPVGEPERPLGEIRKNVEHAESPSLVEDRKIKGLLDYNPPTKELAAPREVKQLEYPPGNEVPNQAKIAHDDLVKRFTQLNDEVRSLPKDSSNYARLKQERDYLYDRLYSSQREAALPRTPTEEYKSSINPVLPRTLSNLPTGLRSFGPLFRSVVDSVRHKTGASGEYIAQRFEDAAREIRIGRGKVNEAINIARELPTARQKPVMEYLHDMLHTGRSAVRLTLEDQTWLAKYKPFIRSFLDESNAAGIMVEGKGGVWRQAIPMEHYIPGVVSGDVLHTLRQNPNSAKARQLQADYERHLISKGLTPAAAKQHVADYVRAANSGAGPTSEFGALRHPQKYGIPLSWMDTNLESLLHKYATRATRDIAFHKAVSNDPVARGILGMADQFGKRNSNATRLPNGATIDPVANQATVDALNYLKGHDSHKDILYQSVGRAIRSTMMGPLTATWDHISSYIQMLPYVKASEAGAFLKAWGKLISEWKSPTGAWQQSHKTGVNAKHLGGIETRASGYRMASEIINKMADIASTVGLRNPIERVTRAHNFAVGSIVMAKRLEQAIAGDAKAAKFIRENFRGVKDVDGLLAGRVRPTQDHIAEMAAQFVEHTQGTYDIRGLPGYALSGELSPFFSLAKWSIEKSNTIAKHVIQPAKEGDFTPLLRYTLGAFLGGEAIQEINEMLKHRKQASPELGEAIAAGGPKDIAGAVAGLMELSGTAGIVSMLGKAAFDISEGRAPRGFINPTANLVTTTFETIRNAAEAYISGEDFMPTMGRAIAEIAKNNVQVWRMAADQLYPEDAARAGKFRDLRIYKELTDQDVEQPDRVSANNLLNPDEKKFKRTGDIGEAAQILGDKLIDKATKSGNPEQIKAKLSGLRSNSYQTVPSPTRTPVAAMSYLDFLDKTQGAGVGSDRLQDYLKQQAINRFKTQLVPQMR